MRGGDSLGALAKVFNAWTPREVAGRSVHVISPASASGKFRDGDFSDLGTPVRVEPELIKHARNFDCEIRMAAVATRVHWHVLNNHQISAFPDKFGAADEPGCMRATDAAGQVSVFAVIRFQNRKAVIMTTQ